MKWSRCLEGIESESIQRHKVEPWGTTVSIVCQVREAYKVHVEAQASEESEKDNPLSVVVWETREDSAL